MGLPYGTALVTGASSGIGRAFACALAAAGTDLVLVARRRPRLEEMAAELAADHARRVDVIEADLTEPDQRAVVEDRLADSEHPIDVLVNSAGFGTEGRFSDLPVEGEEQEVLLNVLCLLRLTHAALPGMIERGRGAVINVSSIAGHQPIPMWATYSATKAFVTSFSRALSAEVEGTGVRVLTLMPGFTRTEFHEQTGLTRELIPGPAWMTPDEVAAIALRALERGRTDSIPGLHYRALATASRLSPWPLTKRVLKVATRRLA
ncbi:MAG: SDR family NAD(P)-dependent oxidoreductase [Acidimicrobiales bacterium]